LLVRGLEIRESVGGKHRRAIEWSPYGGEAVVEAVVKVRLEVWEVGLRGGSSGMLGRAWRRGGLEHTSTSPVLEVNKIHYSHHEIRMRWFLSFLVLALLGVVQALSSSGSRLLVVIEELAEKDKYSKFWDDLTGAYLLLQHHLSSFFSLYFYGRS
jgi:hypothetical protein